MTKQEVLNLINSVPKAYMYVGMKQTTFSNTVKAIKHQTCKRETEINFFKTFGFDLEVSEKLTKIKDVF